jgi:bifunctional enzyme CysN/CysC
MARELFEPGEFLEIYVDTPLETCEARDPKGLYKLARSGELPNLTGIGSAYEPPENPDIVLSAGIHPPAVLAEETVNALRKFQL